MAKQVRLDQELVTRGIAPTRSHAKALVMAGDVLINGMVASRPAASVQPADDITLKERPRFVSRGGEKLAHALDTFDIDVTGTIAADFGASTGGFTDCLLQRGAVRSYAIDVGYGVLDQRIREDPRVVVMERENVRYVTSLPDPIDIVVIDVSFISLSKVYDAVTAVLRPGGRCVPLIKPQFEAGKRDVGKGGVVRDPIVHRRVLAEAIDHATAAGLHVFGLTASSLVGPAGNVEFLADLRQSDEPAPATDEMIDRAMMEAAARIAPVQDSPQ